ncbi:hypothetical protein M0R45_005050 [Rubus argutus]|uniref:Secreted protein n=1 Tax=Rubus argutus TaxID=59490 RepID=A0AAW1YLL5_RUBAR
MSLMPLIPATAGLMSSAVDLTDSPAKTGHFFPRRFEDRFHLASLRRDFSANQICRTSSSNRQQTQQLRRQFTAALILSCECPARACSLLPIPCKPLPSQRRRPCCQ